MIPAEFFDFFMASTGAAAALTGLLFIAVSISPQRIAGPSAPVERRLVAQAVLGYLSDTFFVSLSALIPEINIGLTAMIMSAFFVASTAPAQAMAIVRAPTAIRRIRRGMLLVSAVVVYGWQAVVGLDLTRAPSDRSEVYVLAALVLVLFGISLIRAWELLGASRLGLLAKLSPLKDLDDEEALAR